MRMKLKTLNGYVAREIASPFFVSLFVLTFFLLLGRIMRYADLVLSRGVSFLETMWLFSHLIPFILALTIPIALLMGVLLAFGRLSSESELTAMRAAGVSLYQLLRAPLWFGVFSYIFCAGITLFLIPSANTAFKGTLNRLLHTKAISAIQEGAFDDEIQGVALFVEKVFKEQGTMEGILIFDTKTSPGPMTITAKEGSIPAAQKGAGLTLILKNGSIHFLEGSVYRRIDFNSYTLSLPAITGDDKQRNLSDMTLTELKEEAEKLRALGKAPWAPLVELHERIAVPLACFILALLGVPLGIRNPRSGKVANVSLGIAIVLIYYICLVAGEALGKNGLLPPSLAIWSWNVLLTGVGIFFLYRANVGKSLIPWGQ